MKRYPFSTRAQLQRERDARSELLNAIGLIQTRLSGTLMGTLGRNDPLTSATVRVELISAEASLYALGKVYGNEPEDS